MRVEAIVEPFGGMVTNLIVKRLTASDAAAFREIRLAALEKSPEMFGSVYENEVKKGPEVFAERFEHSSVFVAYMGLELVGLAVLTQESGPKDAHKALLTSVFVLPEMRGKGIADALLSAAIERGLECVEQIMLSVVESNIQAIRLYEKHGFKVYGVEPRALKVGSNYINEVLMARILR